MQKKLYLCIVNPERHNAVGGEPMQIVANESNTIKNKKGKLLWQ